MFVKRARKIVTNVLLICAGGKIVFLSSGTVAKSKNKTEGKYKKMLFVCLLE